MQTSTNTCMNTHAGIKTPVYSHLGLNRVISGMPNNQETERRDARWGFSSRLSCNSLFFTSSLLLWVSLSVWVCVCVCVCVYSGCRLGWLLWYYWVSNKPAREAPMGCTKCFPLAGVHRGAVSCSMSRRTGRRIGRVCSWFPLSNRSLAGAQGLQIPARQGESCRSVCKCVCILIHSQEPEETAVHELHFTLMMCKVYIIDCILI